MNEFLKELAIEAGLNAYAAPLGMIEAGADTFAGQIPTILKVNSSNSLHNGGTAPHQATTASVKDALRLGCSAIGFTIYPGSDAAFDMFEEISQYMNKTGLKFKCGRTVLRPDKTFGDQGVENESEIVVTGGRL